MFRVPQDPANPTFDHTFKVGFGRWMTSSKADRTEWSRRRNAAARTAGRNQASRADTRARAAQIRVEQTQPAAPPTAEHFDLDRTMRTVNRLTRIQLWFLSFELVVYLLLGIGVLVVGGVIVWLFVAS